MKKITFIACVLLFSLTTLVYAQGGKEIVYVENFSYTNGIGNSYVESLRNKIIQGLMNSGRLDVKDVNSEATLKNEQNKQTADASAVDAETLVKMKNLNAKYVIQGHVTTLETVKRTTDKGEVFYSSNAAFDLKIIDIETGTLKEAKSYSLTGSTSPGLLSSGVGDTPDKAFADLLKVHVDTDMKKLVNESFPVEGTILEIAEEKKGKVTGVYINLGSLQGFSKGQVFKVYVEREIAGRKSQKEIGEVKIDAVEGDDISLCKVSKGGDDIKAALGEGQPILIRSIHKTNLLGL